MLRIPKTKPIRLLPLHRAMQAAVPSMIGLSEDKDGATLRVIRQTGAFTASEQTQLLAVFAAHDAADLDQAEARRHARHLAAPQAIRAATSLTELKRAVLDYLKED